MNPDDARFYPYMPPRFPPRPGEVASINVPAVPAETLLALDAEAKARNVSRAQVARERLAGAVAGKVVLSPPVKLAPCEACGATGWCQGCDGTGQAVVEPPRASPCATGPV